MLNELNEVQSRKAGKTEKMSFKNIKDVLSRDEMKGIMAGSGGSGCCVKCKSTDTTSVAIADCDRATVETKCGGSATDATCSCSVSCA